MMRLLSITGCILMLASLVVAGEVEVAAGKIDANSKPTPQAKATHGVTVAVLDFAAKDPGNPDLGKQIAETIAISLSCENGITMVDRADMTKSLQEHELNLSGIVDADTAVRVGHMVGAQILVTGKVFPLGKKLICTAKLIGVETTLVEGVLMKGEPSDMDTLVLELSEKIAEKIHTSGVTLVAKPAAQDDRFTRVQAALKGKSLPTIQLVITEVHHGETAAQRIDPAAETEIKRMLLACGISLRDTKDNQLAKWASSLKTSESTSWPDSLDGVDYVIVGEAFSEFAARVGNLVSCSGRVEINMVERTKRKLILSESRTARNADLSEGIAGKSALQKAGNELGLLILEKILEVSPDKPAASAGADVVAPAAATSVKHGAEPAIAAATDSVKANDK